MQGDQWVFSCSAGHMLSFRSDPRRVSPRCSSSRGCWYGVYCLGRPLAGIYRVVAVTI